MEIKTTLKQLFDLFVGYATEEAPPFIRRFAAQLTVMTAHFQRLEAKLDAEAATREGQIAELAGYIIEMRSDKAGVPAVLPAEPPIATAPTAPVSGGGSSMSEDAEAKAMAAKVMQETAEEIEALSKQAAEPPAQGSTVTPLRKGKSKASAGDAA